MPNIMPFGPQSGVITWWYTQLECVLEAAVKYLKDNTESKSTLK